jgi:hypothetical protein
MDGGSEDFDVYMAFGASLTGLILACVFTIRCALGG